MSSEMTGAILGFGQATGAGNIPRGSCQARQRRQKPKVPRFEFKPSFFISGNDF
jgi:hypothetical protein